MFFRGRNVFSKFLYFEKTKKLMSITYFLTKSEGVKHEKN